MAYHCHKKKKGKMKTTLAMAYHCHNKKKNYCHGLSLPQTRMHLGAFTYNALRTVQGDKVNMAAGGQNWGKFKEKMKELRQGKKGKKDSGKSAKDLETIVVQRLSAEVSGKAQKWST